jgi:hypothetical protein
MKTKTTKIALEGFGSYLGMEKGCFVVKDKQGNTDRYPLFENLIGEIRVKWKLRARDTISARAR